MLSSSLISLATTATCASRCQFTMPPSHAVEHKRRKGRYLGVGGIVRALDKLDVVEVDLQSGGQVFGLIRRLIVEQRVHLSAQHFRRLGLAEHLCREFQIHLSAPVHMHANNTVEARENGTGGHTADQVKHLESTEKYIVSEASEEVLKVMQYMYLARLHVGA